MNFMLLPVCASALAAVACAFVGPLCVARRSSYVAGSVAHACFAGLGAAQWLSWSRGCAWATPDLGALAAALVAALALALRTGDRTRGSDAELSAIWALGMATGLAFLAATPGFKGDLASYLFGSLLFATPGDLARMAALDAALAIAVPLFWRGLLAVSFSPETARLRGAPERLYETVFSVSAALAVVVLVRVTGVVLVVALLVLPSLAAKSFSRTLPGMMVASGIIAFASMCIGLAASWKMDFPPSAPIAFAAAAFAGACAAARHLRPGVRRAEARFRRKIPAPPSIIR